MASKQDMQNMQGKQKLTRTISKHVLVVDDSILGAIVSAILKTDLRDGDDFQNDTYFWAFSPEEINNIKNAKSNSELDDEELTALDTLVAAIREVDDLVEITWSF